MTTATAARVTEPAGSASATVTSVAIGAATESVYYAVGKWTVTTIKMALVAYACHMLVRISFGFLRLTVIATLLFIKYGHRPILDSARAVIYRLFFKPRTGHADLRARGTRADQHGERRLYMVELARMPARRGRENRLRY